MRILTRYSGAELSKCKIYTGILKEVLWWTNFNIALKTVNQKTGGYGPFNWFRLGNMQIQDFSQDQLNGCWTIFKIFEVDKDSMVER